MAAERRRHNSNNDNNNDGMASRANPNDGTAGLIASLMGELQVSKRQADVMQVEVDVMTHDLSSSSVTKTSLSKLEAKIKGNIKELTKKRAQLMGQMPRIQRRIDLLTRKENRQETNEQQIMKLDVDKLAIVSGVNKCNALLADYEKNLEEVSDALKTMMAESKKNREKKEESGRGKSRSRSRSRSRGRSGNRGRSRNRNNWSRKNLKLVHSLKLREETIARKAAEKIMKNMTEDEKIQFMADLEKYRRESKQAVNDITNSLAGLFSKPRGRSRSGSPRSRGGATRRRNNRSTRRK